ncbi:hypothetical protein BDY19DRAFT_993154 [Irpex rosettiformis]|uniref:Uncharacterized protein n=1 Tax=Irpex rosettiformis TaxID=378272 RepID=A0ACB8U5R9_9APHY|nr:hypothetical protein BDY19DRAFT_993154 [Irpex rosettiformis]
MHLSAATVIIAILAAQPAFSVPILASFPSNDGFSTPTSTRVSGLHPISDALRTKIGFESLSLREIDDLMAREDVARELEDLFARADGDESGATLFDTFKKIFKIGGIALDGANIIGNLIPSGSQPQPSAAPGQRRDFNDLEARDLAHFKSISRIPVFPPGTLPFTPFIRPSVTVPVAARELEERKIPINLLGPGISFGPFPGFKEHGPIRNTPIPIQTPHVVAPLPIAQRELVELLARQLADDESGATFASTFGKIVDTVKNVFKDGDKLTKIANGVSIASDASTIIGNLIPGKNQPPPPTQSGAPQARELVELLARQLADDESGATFASTFGKIVDTVKNVFKDGKTLGKIADGASIASSASSVLGGLIHPAPPAQSQAPQARELVEVLERAMEARELNELD